MDKKAPYSQTSNLIKHLETHSELKEWLELFRMSKNTTSQFSIDIAHFKLIKYLAASYMSLRRFRDPAFLDILDPSIICISYHELKNKMIPEFLAKLRSLFNKKLNMAVTISLILDIWTNKINKDFIAIIAVITNSSWERELLVLDISPMVGGHNAENIKEAVEKMINGYKFDKSKISGIYLK